MVQTCMRIVVRVASAGLKEKAQTLLAILAENPFQSPPPYEKLVGDLSGAYLRWTTIHHRVVYELGEAYRTFKVL